VKGTGWNLSHTKEKGLKRIKVVQHYHESATKRRDEGRQIANASGKEGRTSIRYSKVEVVNPLQRRKGRKNRGGSGETTRGKEVKNVT